MAKRNEVTDVRVQVKHPDRRSIYINGKYAFSLSEGIFFTYPIRVGDVLTDEQIHEYQKTDVQKKIKDAAFRLLGYRQRSTREMINRLRQKGWEIEEIQPIIQELTDDGYLNDLEFARSFARDKVSLKFIGPVALRYGLIKAGIDKEIIDQVTAEIYTVYPIESLIRSILKKRNIKPEKKIDSKEKTRIINLLKRKGFSWADIEPVISVLKTH